MRGNATESGGQNQFKRQSRHGGSFAKAHDGRKQPIRSFWIHKG